MRVKRSNDVECPHCGFWNEVSHDDGENYAEDVEHEMECYECEEAFSFYTHISLSYRAVEVAEAA